MNSMTGYGRGEATNGEISVVVELKTVNNRFRDLNLRIPRDYMVLEPQINKVLQSAISRGRVDLFLKRSASESDTNIAVDPILARRYQDACLEVLKSLGRDESVPLSLILQQPGVMTSSA